VGAGLALAGAAAMLDPVARQPGRVGEGVGADRVGPAVAEVAGQVQLRGEPAGGAGQLGGPAGQLRQVAAAGGQPPLQVTLEAQQQLGRLGSRVSRAGAQPAQGRPDSCRPTGEGVAPGGRRGDLAVAGRPISAAVVDPDDVGGVHGLIVLGEQLGHQFAAAGDADLLEDGLEVAADRVR
jgi:hypothetical protein